MKYIVIDCRECPVYSEAGRCNLLKEYVHPEGVSPSCPIKNTGLEVEPIAELGE